MNIGKGLMRKNGKTQTAADIAYANLERISTIKTVHRCISCMRWVYEEDDVIVDPVKFLYHIIGHHHTTKKICGPVNNEGIRLVTNHGRVLSPEQVKEYPIV